MSSFPTSYSTTDIRRRVRLPSPPGVALQILRLCRQDDAPLYELARVIGMDPALCARLLRFANSPAMGTGHRVSSVRAAVLLLGLRTVKLLALGFSLLSADFEPRCPSFNVQRFWRDSFLRATVARGLAARFIQTDKEEAFAAGLLSGVGRLAQAVSEPDEYEKVLRAVARGRSLPEAEAETFGFDHVQFGAELLADWELPEPLIQAMLAQRSTETAPSAPPLNRIMQIAPKFAEVMLADLDTSAPAVDASWLRPTLEIEESIWKAFAEDIMRDFRSVANTFGFELDNEPEAPDLVSEACEEAIRIGMISQLEQSRLARSHDDLLRRATTDPLTGVANRARFTEKLEEAVRGLARGIEPFGVLLYDLDHFKGINDTYGHQFGDKVLCEVTRAVQAVLRSIDTLARYGGEEFIVLLPKVDSNGLCTVARRILQNVDSLRIKNESETVTVTISAGFVLTADYATIPDAEKLVQDADAQLYLSKKAGRNTWHYRDRSSDSQRRDTRRGLLSRAITRLRRGN